MYTHMFFNRSILLDVKRENHLLNPIYFRMKTPEIARPATNAPIMGNTGSPSRKRPVEVFPVPVPKLIPLQVATQVSESWSSRASKRDPYWFGEHVQFF